MWSTTIDTARFNANLRRLAGKIAAEAEGVVDKTSGNFDAHLKRNTPTDLGDLKGTIKTVKTSSAGKIEAVTTIGNDALEIYAAPLEFGHTLKGNHIEGKHFIFPLARLYNKRFKAALRRAAKRVFRDFT